MRRPARPGRELASRKFGWPFPTQTEPPKWPTETNGGSRTDRPWSGRSLVRYRATSTANTPRIRGLFRIHRRIQAGSLCTQRLDGGGGTNSSLGLIPVMQGKYREIFEILTLLAGPHPRCPSLYAVMEKDPLRQGTGISIHRAGKPWPVISLPGCGDESSGIGRRRNQELDRRTSKENRRSHDSTSRNCRRRCRKVIRSC